MTTNCYFLKQHEDFYCISKWLTSSKYNVSKMRNYKDVDKIWVNNYQDENIAW